MLARGKCHSPASHTGISFEQTFEQRSTRTPIAKSQRYMDKLFMGRFLSFEPVTTSSLSTARLRGGGGSVSREAPLDSRLAAH